MTDPSSFAKLVPGFDFLQGLVKNAGAALPGIGQWVAPTIDPAELEKRIEELRTVQFWLEQNARMLGATIQALEVQRMTLSTLKTMNVQMEDLRDSLQIRMPASPASAPAAAPAAAREAVKEPARKPEEEEAEPAASPPASAPKSSAKAKTESKEPAAGVVDPLQWWGALTKQFTELATTAMKDTSTDAARSMAGAMMKKSFEAASQTAANGASAPAKSAGKAPAKKNAGKSAKTTAKPASRKPAASQ